MSYLVLARKWRPQTFEEVIGQSHVTRTLQNALSSGKVAHALIFSGPRGVGKTSVARILAKSLNCADGPAHDPCNICDICKQITAGSCVDVNEIDGASNRGIDEIRQLREEIRFQPVLCRFRIYIIDEVHMLTNEAFNALLKTLEEPPPHAYFIFATTEPRKIPETIHSRCQHYEFRRLSETDLAAHLDKIVAQEGLKIPKEATQLIARQAQGSVRDSLSLLDQVAAFGATTYEEVCQALGVAGIATVEDLASALLVSDVQKSLSILDNVYELGIDIHRLAQDLLRFMRDLAVIKKVDTKTACLLTHFSQERVKELQAKFSNIAFETILLAVETLSSSLDELYRSLTPRISLELLLMKVCTLEQFTSLDEVLNRLERLIQEVGTSSERGLQAEHVGGENKDFKPVESPSNRSISGDVQPPPQTTPDVHTELRHEPNTQIGKEQDTPLQRTAVSSKAKSVKQHWNEFVEFVKRNHPSIGSALDACIEVKELGDGRFKILCTGDVRGEMLCSREKSSQIAALASKFFNSAIDLVFEIAEEESESPSHVRQPTGKRPPTSPRDELIQNPLVQEALNVFQARISNVTLYNKHNNNKTRS